MDIRRMIFIDFLLLLLKVRVDGFPMDDLINKLPGQPDVTFRQFAGYIDVDENVNGRSLFYYFVEAEKDPLSQPLTIWLTGGPGCSSVGDGFTSVGPFTTTNDARALQPNLFSWNKASNLLFIDSPIGSGWSYSNTDSDYSNGDDSTTKILVAFMLKWYEKYPDFKSKDLYIAGSSFAGHFVPNLANALLDQNKQSKDSKFNVKGLVLGNPMLRAMLDNLARYDLFLSRGMINSSLYDEVKKECNGIDENKYSSSIKIIKTLWTQSCEKITHHAVAVAFNATDGQKFPDWKLFDVSRDPCTGNVEDLNLGKEVTTVSDGVDMCRPLRADFYFNLQEVQKAFHGNRTNLSYAWKGCSTDKFKYNEDDEGLDMLPALENLLQQSIPITILSGDQDGIAPTNGTLHHLFKLADELKINSRKDEAWSFENQGGGWKYLFGDLLTFFRVKGGNHHVTASQPSEALYIFKNFIGKST